MIIEREKNEIRIVFEKEDSFDVRQLVNHSLDMIITLIKMIPKVDDGTRTFFRGRIR